MELSGTIAANLRRAIDSVRRHHGKPVYDETVRYWEDLLTHARERTADGDRLIATLERVLAERSV